MIYGQDDNVNNDDDDDYADDYDVHDDCSVKLLKVM